MIADIVFKFRGVECVEGPSGDVAHGIIIDNWLACKSVENIFMLGTNETYMKRYLAQSPELF